MGKLYGWTISEFVTQDMRIQILNADGLTKFSADLDKIKAIALDVSENWRCKVTVFSVIGYYGPEISWFSQENSDESLCP